MKTNKITMALLGAGLIGALSGCGGGGDSASSGGSSATVSMTATPALGRFRHGTSNQVQVSLYQNGSKYKDGVWSDATGSATFTGLTGTETNLIVQVEGGEYYDEATGSQRTFAGNKMRTVIEKPYAAVAITPLTNAAANRLVDDTGSAPKLITGKIATDILTENTKEGARFGLSNPVNPPALVNETERVKSDHGIHEQKYALVLAAMAEAAKQKGSTPADMAKDFAKDLKDGKLDGKEGAIDIAAIKFDLAAMTTNFAATAGTAATAVQAAGYTGLAALAPTVIDTEVTEAEVKDTVTAVTNAGDGLGQARALFSTLRTGILPYANPSQTGYTQTELTAVEANFRSLQSSATSAGEQIRAINRAATLTGTLLGDGELVTNDPNYGGHAAARSVPGELSCFNDKVNLGLYPAGTTFAAGCRILKKLPVAGDPSKYDRIVYLVYTDKATVNATDTPTAFSLNDSLTLKWSGRIDRFDAVTNLRVIKGVNPKTVGQTEDDASARQPGTISASVVANGTTTSGTTSTNVGTISLGALTITGDMWPILADTEKASIALNAAADFSYNESHSLASWSNSSTLALKLNGSVIAKNGTLEVAKLTFAPTSGATSNAVSGSATSGSATSDSNVISNGLLDTKISFATTAYEVSGALKVTGLTTKIDPVKECWYQFVGSGGTHNFDSSTSSFVVAAIGTGEYIVGGCWQNQQTLPATVDFTGTVKNLTTATTIFEGKFSASANYDHFSPFLPDSATNYVAGTATISGALKKSSTDPGISLSVVATRNTSAPANYVASYTDGNNKLTLSAKWTEGGASVVLENNLSAGVKVVIAITDSIKTALVKTADDKKIGEIEGNMVKYVDGYTESII